MVEITKFIPKICVKYDTYALEHFHDDVTFLDVPKWRQLAALDLADGFHCLEVDAGRDDLVAEVAIVAPPALTSAPPEPGDWEGTQTTRLNLVAH